MNKAELLNKLDQMLVYTKSYIFDTYHLTDEKYKEAIKDYEEAADLIADAIDNFYIY